AGQPITSAATPVAMTMLIRARASLMRTALSDVLDAREVVRRAVPGQRAFTNDGGSGIRDVTSPATMQIAPPTSIRGRTLTPAAGAPLREAPAAHIPRWSIV